MITISEDRLRHCLGVGRLMKEISLEKGESMEYAQEMFLLGYLHDIGYEFSSVQTEHNKIGGEMLKASSYRYWKEVYYHGEVQDEYWSKELDLLNACDMMVSSGGERISPQDRLSDIASRYGDDSPQFLTAFSLAKKLGLIE